MSILHTAPARPQRSARLAVAPIGTDPGMVEISVHGRRQFYQLRRRLASWGRAFTLTKLGTATTYDVNVGQTADTSTCDCLGNIRHGSCKHVSGLRALLDAGKL